MAVGNCRLIDGLKPVGGMVMVQTAFAAVNIFYKLALNDGMSVAVLVAYRYIFAAVSLAPVAFFLERKKRPRLTWMVLVHTFFCGLFGGTLIQNLYISGLKLTSVTFASAMANLVPAITFMLAFACGLEKLSIKMVSGVAKVMGTLVGLGGAMLLTFYKGPELHLWSTSIDLLQPHLQHQVGGGPGAVAAAHTLPPARPSTSGNRVIGSLLCVGSCFSYAIWLIIQAKMSKYYPCSYSSTALMCVMASLQAFVYALCVEKGHWDAWKLGYDIRLLSVVYCGVVASGPILAVLAWCIKKKGPLYASVFNPLMLVIVAIASSLLLEENLHVGSLLGAVLIVIGLYLVIWGKGRETGRVGEMIPLSSTGSTATVSEPIHAVADRDLQSKPEGEAREQNGVAHVVRVDA